MLNIYNKNLLFAMSEPKITTRVLSDSFRKSYLELKCSDRLYKSGKDYKLTTNEVLEYLDLMNEYENIELHFNFSNINLREIFEKLHNVRSLHVFGNNDLTEHDVYDDVYDDVRQPDVYDGNTIQIYPTKLETLVLFMKIRKRNFTSLFDWNYVACLPSTLKNLSLLDYIDPLPILPSGLKTLALSGWFNQPVDNLPNSLEVLYLGEKFNQTLDNLPNSLKKLDIASRCFNYPVDNLPVGLEILTLCCVYRKPINNLPITLKYLNIRSYISPEPRTLNTLPDSIEHLVIDFKNDKNIDKLPANLKFCDYVAHSDYSDEDLNILNFLKKKYPNVQFRKVK
jgi:hypothetical protein